MHRKWTDPIRAALLGLVILLAGAPLVKAGTVTKPGAAAVTLEELRDDPLMTPQRFVTYFRDFKFKLYAERQDPKVFLSSRCGDCDDFACLADEILRRRNYTTRLIAIFMDGQTHVVCYVDQIRGYLDYNCRGEPSAVQYADDRIDAVADKVAAYFRVPWRYASEFTCQDGQPRFGRIVFH